MMESKKVMTLTENMAIWMLSCMSIDIELSIKKDKLKSALDILPDRTSTATKEDLNIFIFRQ
jgi:hypothetical protein